MNDNRAMTWWIAGTLLLTPLIVICVRFVDVPVALFVKEHLYSNAKWSSLTSELPDLLLVVVLLTTFLAVSLYVVRSKKGIYDVLTSFAKLVSWSAPVSYLVKSVLKFSFGRINTRTWLRSPDQYGFHWFHGGGGFDGFPSGHMLVVVTLLAALCRFYPSSRTFCACISLLLGTALVATNYHFLGDVVAGAYFGLLTERVLYRMLLNEPREVGFTAI